MVDEATVRKYKADLTDEVEPQIRELLARADKGLKLLMKRETMLQTRVRTAIVCAHTFADNCPYASWRHSTPSPHLARR